MSYRTQLVSALAALALVAGGACGSKSKKDTTTTESTGPDTSGGKKNIPVDVKDATGEMRDLLLTLRRVHFPFDSNKLSESARQALTEASEKLKAMPSVRLRVEGHADPRGTSEYNIALADERARAVADFLIALGVEENRLKVVSMGEEDPIAKGSTRLAYAKNRRVDFRLIEGDIEFQLAEGDLLDDEGNVIGEGDLDDDGDDDGGGDEDGGDDAE